MKKFAFNCALILLSVGSLYAQQTQKLYVPRNIEEAYTNGTRSRSGAPGKNYWQNSGDYTISMHVNPPDRTIKGFEQIIYHNNSPDTLKSLVFSLILNSHKPGSGRATAKKFRTSGLHIDKYKVNGSSANWNSQHDRTVKREKLQDPLAPGDSVHLAINWHYKLSRQSGREGAIDTTTFYLAYFYPRVAVYDDYNGWDTMDFTGSQEFYNDFNNYKFSVTVPQHYLVWATGTLQNAEEVLQPRYADRLQKSMNSDSIIHVVTPEDLESKEVTAGSGATTWKWQANHITDVALAVSNEYNWDAGSVLVDKKSGRRASVQSAYADTAADYHHMVQYGKHALGWLSKYWPGVPYPFPKTTIVSGYADMEYPMMVNDRSTTSSGGIHLNSMDNLQIARFVAEHELAHSWFPFYMGINETRWGFMDEGWATTFEYLIGINDLGKKRADGLFRKFRVNSWTSDPTIEAALPIITPGNILSGRALGDNEYGKAALGYFAVKDLLGDAAFRKSLHGFIDRWHGKHPMPWDMFYSFSDLSGQNLNWFWKNWYFSRNYIDIAVDEVRMASNKVTIRVNNIGGFAIPFDVIAHFNDDSTQRFHQTPMVWKTNPEEADISISPQKTIQSITLDTGIYVDADSANNSWKR